MNHAAVFSTGVQCRQFLEKKFEQYLITCLTDTKHVRELKVFSTTCSNMRQVIYYIYNIRKYKVVRTAVASGFGFQFKSPYIRKYRGCIEINVEKEVLRKIGARILNIYSVKTGLTRK